jgi:hypothetical protein
MHTKFSLSQPPFPPTGPPRGSNPIHSLTPPPPPPPSFSSPSHVPDAAPDISPPRPASTAAPPPAPAPPPLPRRHSPAASTVACVCRRKRPRRGRGRDRRVPARLAGLGLAAASLGQVAPVPGRVLEEEGLEPRLSEVGAILAWSLDGEVGDDGGGGHFLCRWLFF